AGRDAIKLGRVATETGADVERIVADASDSEALRAMAEATKVVVSTVGPYALYGSELVAAVAAAGTDYCDLTGEPQWMRRMIDAHSDTATSSGARIIHACGFDCIPSDLGVWFLQQRAQERFGDACNQVSMRVVTMKGGASGGTIASMMNLMEEAAADPDLRKLLADPYLLAPPDQRSGPPQPDINRPAHDDVSGQWVAPFVMAAVNTRVVQRSHALLGRPWGNDFTYDEAMAMGTGPLGAVKAGGLTAGLAAGMGLAAIGPARRALSRYVLPKPGDGPSPEAQENGSFDLRFYGATAKGDTITTRVTGDRDPGYSGTARMLAEAATALVDLAPAEVGGGFWTPSSALGDRLVERLEADAGLRFDVTA
ncbi:MAG: saccharopine dehydrogenase, partial [Aquihabitans sp.]